MKIAGFALLMVVALDVMSQGLVIPILNTIIMDPAQDLLPADTTVAVRQFDFGLAMGIFFLCWFLGAAYISKISDFIGRKEGILICLSGNLLGYILTIAALEVDSLALLLVARAVTGFTAGNQPIAQAALVDISENEQQKARFMGLVVMAISVGLVAGPLIGGLLSDADLLGEFASLELPFYCAALLVVVNMTLIIVFFHNQKRERRPFKIRPLEVFLTLWTAAKRPTVLKLSLVFFFAQLALNSFYVFMDNYFYSRFQFDTLQNALSLIVMGAGLGLASAFLVAPINARFDKTQTIIVSLAVMAVAAALSIVNPSPFLAYVLIILFIVPFAVYYPTALTMFSAAVDDSEQGWVMGVTVALYTLGAGIVSVIGGEMMSIDIHLPFVISMASLILALVLVFTLWRGGDIRALDQR
ncbi:MAG: TCR/Tet family MFS transporter [Alphaproteobacteria bacterium]|nr:TCR/Tet family MFS transporter [Alphaproteobacteria bacterium]